MAVDYNLVILGGGRVARHAADYAARWGARVALVVPTESVAPGSLQQMVAYLLAASPRPEEPSAREARLAEAIAFATWQMEQGPLTDLAAQGVDVVWGSGRFTPSLGVQGGDRHLRGRRYLIAIEASPNDSGLQASRLPDLTLSQLQRPDLSTVAVWGSGPQALSLAQAVQRLGLSTVLASPSSLLSGEDRAIAALLQAQLEAEGVCIITGARVVPRSSAAQKPQISAESFSVAVDGILQSSDRPNLAPLNLPKPIAATPDGLSVNARLQTAHPSIYACGDALGGDRSLAVSLAEAEIAVANALSIPYRRIRYRRIPRTINTVPPVVAAGLTAQQAKRRHRDVVVLEQSLATMPRAQLAAAGGETTPGLCRLILSRGGKILGFYAVGPCAGEWAVPMLWAVERGKTIAELPRSPLAAPPAYSDVVARLVAQWQQRRKPNWQRDLLELAMNWQRDWTR